MSRVDIAGSIGITALGKVGQQKGMDAIIGGEIGRRRLSSIEATIGQSIDGHPDDLGILFAAIFEREPSFRAVGSADEELLKVGRHRRLDGGR